MGQVDIARSLNLDLRSLLNLIQQLLKTGPCLKPGPCLKLGPNDKQHIKEKNYKSATHDINNRFQTKETNQIVDKLKQKVITF